LVKVPFSPVEEEKFHREVVEIAKGDYCRAPDAIPLRVRVYFWSREGGSGNKRDMARELVEFVKSHPAGTYKRRDSLPKGLSVVHIDPAGDDWMHVESGVTSLSEIFEQLASTAMF
jgi:hypothetical protein